MTARIVGIAKGPGETPHEYTFVTPDRDQLLKNGEFVYYEVPATESNLQILGRVTKRIPLKLYPDSFMSNPDVSPGAVAGVVGYDSPGHELFELTVVIMGFYDESLQDFVNPRVPPTSGKSIYLAGDEMLSRVLSKRRLGEPGSAHIGSMLSRSEEAVPIVLDVKEFASTHLAIIAGTGSGKSYLASVIIEELMRPANKACILIVDPHGEYETLIEMMNKAEFSITDGGLDYRPKVKIFQPADVKVKVSSLTIGDLNYLLPNMTERMEYLLRRAYHEVGREKQEKWTSFDLMSKLREIAEGSEGSSTGGDFTGTAEALIWRLESRLKQGAFDDFRHLDLRDLFKPGQCSVLQLNEIDSKDQQVIVSTLLRRLNRARMATERKEVDSQNEMYLPYPVFVLVEEAHHFAPASGDVVSTGVLKQILAEGRKFGIGIGLISQRPGKLDPDVLSQCMTQFVMRIVNPIDQNSVASAVESVGRDLLQELPALSKGQVIVAGSSINTPVLCRVRKRLTRHGGESKDAPKLWNEYFNSDETRRRERDESILKPDRKRGLLKLLGDSDE
ncbi:MAG: ATP-binding protein [Chloroflexi bacterium]|nr:ATP-binding protein [Chloroflexota bacterium]